MAPAGPADTRTHAHTEPQVTADAPEAEQWRRRPFSPRFVAPLFMGATLNPVNSSLIATALVSIAASMGVSVGQTSILISSLYLTSAIAQPTAGRLAEEFGPRRVFLAGIVVVLHRISLVLIVIGAVVLLMTVFDRHLKPSRDIPAPRKENNPMPASATSPTIVPTQTALLLMDYQNAVLGSLPDAAPVLDRARQALDWARKNAIQVVFVRVAFAEEDFARIPAHSKVFAAVAENRFLLDGTEPAALHDSLEARDGDLLVRKTRFGAFSTTELYRDLHANGVDTLVVAGISTSGVVLSTLRDAADQDYRLFVLADATADPDPEVHRVLIEKVFPHQADILETGDLAALTVA